MLLWIRKPLCVSTSFDLSSDCFSQEDELNKKRRLEVIARQGVLMGLLRTHWSIHCSCPTFNWQVELILRTPDVLEYK